MLGDTILQAGDSVRQVGRFYSAEVGDSILLVEDSIPPFLIRFHKIRHLIWLLRNFILQVGVSRLLVEDRILQGWRFHSASCRLCSLIRRFHSVSFGFCYTS